MDRLPSTDEQEWLLRELARLVAARGARSFLEAPIVLPTPEFFPDPIRSPGELIDRVTRRLMQLAGLGELDVGFSSLAGESRDDTPAGVVCERASACFYGIEDGRCHFGVHEELEADPHEIAGVMAHEVAHAYRARHDLVRGDDHEEERLTDLTTCALGFGVLSLTVSHRFRKWGTLTEAAWSASASGYLPPQAHAFLLAAQVTAQRLSGDERRAVAGHLEANQAAFLEAAEKHFAQDPTGLDRRLGLPDDRPRRRRAKDVLQPLRAYSGAFEPEPADPERDWTGWNRGRTVSRVRESRRLENAAFHAGLFGLGGLALSMLAFKSWLGLPLFGLAGLAYGLRRGWSMVHDVCSAHGCEAVLPEGAATCPKCGGRIDAAG
jgi:hypothetical protein